MKDNRLEQLKKQYEEIPIPDELEFVVQKALKDGAKMRRKNKFIQRTGQLVAALAASVVLLTAVVNVSPAVAKNVADVPVVGNLVQVLTFREYRVDEDFYQANLKVPAIDGLENKELAESLNAKYLRENQQLYEQFMADVQEMKKLGGGHLGVDSGYVVKTDNDSILSVGRYVVNTAASSSTVFKYDTIDKKKEILITLPSLFKDESYVDIISANIKQQMREQMKADENKIYWIETPGEEDFFDPFEKIDPEQNFYISPESKLVISFDKYDVAPGYMGVVEFTIPTTELKDILVGQQYIR